MLVKLGKVYLCMVFKFLFKLLNNIIGTAQNYEMTVHMSGILLMKIHFNLTTKTKNNGTILLNLPI
jgi:hypothetical protein